MIVFEFIMLATLSTSQLLNREGPPTYRELPAAMRRLIDAHCHEERPRDRALCRMQEARALRRVQTYLERAPDQEAVTHCVSNLVHFSLVRDGDILLRPGARFRSLTACIAMSTRLKDVP